LSIDNAFLGFKLGKPDYQMNLWYPIYQGLSVFYTYPPPTPVSSYVWSWPRENILPVPLVSGLKTSFTCLSRLPAPVANPSQMMPGLQMKQVLVTRCCWCMLV